MELAALFEKLVSAIISGGPSGVIAILIAIIIYLVYEKIQIQRKYNDLITKIEAVRDEASKEQEDEYIDIINRYHQGQVKTLEAIQQLHIVLARIEGRL